MSEIIIAHIEEIQDNANSLVTELVRMITTDSDASHRRVDWKCDILLQTLECMKELVVNIKSKNRAEWSKAQQQ